MNVFFENVIGIHEAARILGITSGHVKNLCADGKIVAKKIGRTWVIDRSRLRGVR
ncbi:helix-turn-helix domain-containing protein [Bacillus sp. TL12]|uniref:helix-turn-helix domain-containing protein n=1 Tax=Bacillus sp. TL12 TaxID=2894756 RepID=UPI001F527727|nr:helix-turn-helix domain-containing protein [Bacillus sp. TL12]MCI0766049.1 helix-turn-helix domain-containing protein [Bacillus sp. TL12]